MTNRKRDNFDKKYDENLVLRSGVTLTARNIKYFVPEGGAPEK
jgi:hypothetical protein